VDAVADSAGPHLLSITIMLKNRNFILIFLSPLNYSYGVKLSVSFFCCSLLSGNEIERETNDRTVVCIPQIITLIYK
jgi:predicted membrane protein